MDYVPPLWRNSTILIILPVFTDIYGNLNLALKWINDAKYRYMTRKYFPSVPLVVLKREDDAT